jgi:acyl dehydratase
MEFNLKNSNDIPKAARLSFEQIQVGSIYEFTRQITREDVLGFAALTGDHNPLHVDEAFAAKSDFGRNIVHGMLASSLFSTLVGMYCPGERSLYLSQSVNFRKPLFFDDQVTVRAEVVDKSEATRIVTLKTEVLRGSEKVITGEAKVKVLGL